MPALERELRITGDDVERFAAASGDRNPLHLDPVYARRTAFGEPVVHGALATVALLGCLPELALADVRSVRVSFAGPLLPGTPVAAALAPDPRRESGWRGALSARGKQLLRLEAWGAGDDAARPPFDDAGADDGPMRERPADVDVDGVAEGHEVGGAYRTGHELRALARDWDAGALDGALLEGLAWASYVVGMELPGLRSLLAGIRLTAVDSAADGATRHRVRVARADPRTGRLLLDGVLGGPHGPRAVASLEAFGRPRPAAPAPVAQPQAGAATATGAVVVVGASRGFGASLALSLLGAGYSVHALYAVSRDAAEGLRLAAGAHADRLSLHQVDARDSAGVESVAAAVRESGMPLRGVVLNAAPPPLPMRLTATSAGDLAAYVADSLARAAAPLGALLPLLEAPGAWVVFCSSAALTEPPPEWPHYVTAKGGLEGLARWAAAVRPEARVLVVRAPKMATDFTSSPSGAVGAAPADGVAARVVERLVGDALPAGLTVLDAPVLS